jgi:uncharacterized RDD family membrane protein YckC
MVTGEAVALDLPIARLATRGLAMLLDVFLQLALLFILLLVMTLTIPGDEGSLALTVGLVGLVLVLVGYPVLMETLTRGRTLGKLAVGLRVVRADGGPIRFRQALARGLGGFFVDFWALGFLGAVSIIVSLVSRDGKRVGDYLAGTVVIRERVAVTPATLIPMPPPLAHWASQLDLSALSDGLALAIREYLSRMTELRPEAAHALGYGLAQQVGQAIGAPLPPNVPVWAYLSAILAERRGRDQARVFGAPPGYLPPPTAPPVAELPPSDSPFAPPS